MPRFPLPWLGLLTGERQWPCDGRCVSVWAVRQRAGSAGAQCTVAALLQEGDLHSLAQPKWGQCGHQSHLPTDCTRGEIWGVPVWQGMWHQQVLVWSNMYPQYGEIDFTEGNGESSSLDTWYLEDYDICLGNSSYRNQILLAGDGLHAPTCCVSIPSWWILNERVSDHFIYQPQFGWPQVVCNQITAGSFLVNPDMT